MTNCSDANRLELTLQLHLFVVIYIYKRSVYRQRYIYVSYTSIFILYMSEITLLIF